MAWFTLGDDKKNGLLGLDSDAELIIDEAVCIDGDENSFYMVASVSKTLTKLEGVGDAKDKEFTLGVYTIICPKREYTNQKGKKQAPTSFQRALLTMITKGKIDWGKPFSCVIQPVPSSLIEQAGEDEAKMSKLLALLDVVQLDAAPKLEGKTNVGKGGGGQRQYKSFAETMADKLNFIKAMAKDGSPLDEICELIFDTHIAPDGEASFTPLSKNEVLKGWVKSLLG